MRAHGASRPGRNKFVLYNGINAYRTDVIINIDYSIHNAITIITIILYYNIHNHNEPGPCVIVWEDYIITSGVWSK